MPEQTPPLAEIDPIEEDDELVLYGVTHMVRIEPVEGDRWDFMLTVTSPAGTGQALLTPDECIRLREYLDKGRDAGSGAGPQGDRCRCSGEEHVRYSDDCFLVGEPDPSENSDADDMEDDL